MLDDIFNFLIEPIAESAIEDRFRNSSFRIKGHPYLTCIYRGLLITILLFIGMTIWHFSNDVSLMETLTRDLIFSASIGAIVAFILLFITASWRLFSPRDSFRQ